MKKRRKNRTLKIVYGISVFLVTVLMLWLGIMEQPDLFEKRNVSRYRTVSGYLHEEEKREDTPVGVVQVYRFPLENLKPDDECLAFYVVHQYVDVYLDNELLYHLGPSEQTDFVKTTGSNWVMIPLYAADEGKLVRVEVTPVYSKFVNWKIDFLVGSRLSIFLDRLEKDMPQITLGLLAILIGLVFCALAFYHYIWKKYDDKLSVLGISAIFVGVWRLTDTRFSPMVLGSKPTFLLYLSFVMLMIGIVPLIKAIQFRFDDKSQIPFQILCVLASVSCIVQTLLQLFGVLDLRPMLPVTHLIIILFALVLIVCIVMDFRRDSKKGIQKHRMFFICGLGALADVVAYYIKGNSSGLLFTLAAFLLYVVISGIITMEGYMEQEKRLEEQEKELAESRISIMMSQIQPHFLYNSLNAIYHLCGKNPQMAKTAISNFSDYLRGNLDSLKRKTPVPFETELKHIEVYLSLEKMRFDEELDIVYDIQTKDFMVPALAVQPLVENAVKYGIGESEHGGTVRISTREYDTYYEIAVEDDGAGYDTLKKTADSKSHIGIENVRKRLWTMCRATLTIDSETGKGTNAVIKLPKEEQEDGDSRG